MSLLGWLTTNPSEEARREGRLVYDYCSDSFAEIEPLPCQSDYVRIKEDVIECAKCGTTRSR